MYLQNSGCIYCLYLQLFQPEEGESDEAFCKRLFQTDAPIYKMEYKRRMKAIFKQYRMTSILKQPKKGCKQFPVQTEYTPIVGHTSDPKGSQVPGSQEAPLAPTAYKVPNSQQAPTSKPTTNPNVNQYANRFFINQQSPYNGYRNFE